MVVNFHSRFSGVDCSVLPSKLRLEHAQLAQIRILVHIPTLEPTRPANIASFKATPRMQNSGVVKEDTLAGLHQALMQSFRTVQQSAELLGSGMPSVNLSVQSLAGVGRGIGRLRGLLLKREGCEEWWSPIDLLQTVGERDIWERCSRILLLLPSFQILSYGRISRLADAERPKLKYRLCCVVEIVIGMVVVVVDGD